MKMGGPGERGTIQSSVGPAIVPQPVAHDQRGPSGMHSS